MQIYNILPDYLSPGKPCLASLPVMLVLLPVTDRFQRKQGHTRCNPDIQLDFRRIDRTHATEIDIIFLILFRYEVFFFCRNLSNIRRHSSWIWQIKEIRLCFRILNLNIQLQLPCSHARE